MAKAELSFNPYLLNTEIRFNGQEPRINSLVEKYKDKPLQFWIKDIPKIFYDEMNGFGFEFHFDGTVLDFEELIQAFRDVGVKDEVTFKFRNELEDRSKKQQDMDLLIKWLFDNPNKRFDFERFYEDNRDIFYDGYPFIVFHGQYLDVTHLDAIEAAVEKVDSTKELENTDLTYTPIIYCIDESGIDELPADISFFLSRSDVDSMQMFFLVNDGLDRDNVCRMIQDLGIKTPQIVDTVDDSMVIRYFQLFPLSEYLYSGLNLLRDTRNKIDAELTAESEKNKVANAVIYDEIKRLELIIHTLKETLSEFLNLDNLSVPSEWYLLKQAYLDVIRKWRARKTKITKIDEAETVAKELDSDVRVKFGDYFTKLEELKQAEANRLFISLKGKFEAPGFSISEDQINIELPVLEGPVVESLVSNLLGLKTELYVEPQKDIFNFFKKNDSTCQELVLETTFYYQEWRDYAEHFVTPLTENMIESQFDILCAYKKNTCGCLHLGTEETH